MRSLLAISLIALVGCKKVEPIPEELDDLMHYFWVGLEDGTDEDLIEALDNLHRAIDGNQVGDDFVEGEVSDLNKAEVSDLGVEGVDPRDATGVLLVDRVGCTVAGLEAVISYEDQDELYTGVYDSFDRTNTLPTDDYLEGRSDWLSWDLVYTTSALGAGYEVSSTTVVRRVRDARGAGEHAVLLRAHMVEPARFDNPDTNQFLDQDYHLEIYWPHRGGLLHVYALWKNTRLLGFEDEDEATQRITLNKLAQWDDGTTQLCEEGRP